MLNEIVFRGEKLDREPIPIAIGHVTAFVGQSWELNQFLLELAHQTWLAQHGETGTVVARGHGCGLYAHHTPGLAPLVLTDVRDPVGLLAELDVWLPLPQGIRDAIDREDRAAVAAFHALKDHVREFVADLLMVVHEYPDVPRLLLLDNYGDELHPHVVRGLTNYLYKQAALSDGLLQVVLATNNPEVCNCLKLDDIVVSRRERDGSTRIRRLSEHRWWDDRDGLEPGDFWAMFECQLWEDT